MIKKRAEYVQYLADIQWGQYTEMALDKRIQFVVLDEIYKCSQINQTYKQFLAIAPYHTDARFEWERPDEECKPLIKTADNPSYQDFITQCSKKFAATTKEREYSVLVAAPVSYTHLTLPTILLV